jgi:cell wall-associated NlpC family hydrolase
VKKSRAYADLLKKMEPGDVVFTRYASKESPNVELDKFGELPVRAKDLVQVSTGSPTYHGQLYLGGGKVGQAQGGAHTYDVNKTYDDWSGQDVKVYRPTKAAAAERKAALKFVQDARGTPYTSVPETVKQALANFAGVSPSSEGGGCRIGPKGGINCTTSITSAYPKQFPKLYMTPDEMRAVEGMELVGRYGRAGKLTPYEHLISRALHPALKNLKWGALAGLGAYGLSRAAGSEGGDDAR